MKTSVLQKEKELAIASSLFIFIPKHHPLKELRGRHVVSIQFLFWSEVFSVYTVSRDTYDNIFTAHDLFVNV